MWKEVKRVVGAGLVLYGMHRSAKLTDLSSTRKEREAAGIGLLAIFFLVLGTPLVIITCFPVLCWALGSIVWMIAGAMPPNTWPFNGMILFLFIVGAIMLFVGAYLNYLSSNWEEIDWDDESKIIAEKKIGDTTYQLRK